jgi:peptidoglycan/xylan/chitin deacetylase (PgdA/CDA1 family)
LRESVPILTYHSLDPSRSVISVSPELFRAHVRGLRARGFRAVALGEVLEAWSSGRTLPARTVVLTFDDGFASVREVAAPVLEEAGFRATVFVVAGHVGGRNDWPTQGRGVPVLPLLSASDLRALLDSGFEIGAHGVTHAPLDGLGEAAAEEEIAGARRRLEECTGAPVPVFAYPDGRADARARRIVAAHYRGACSTELRAAGPGDPRDWLPRLDAYYLRARVPFRLLGTGWGAAYVGVRRLGRAARAALHPIAASLLAS